jgi:ribosome-associated translation inhibitor RaiA
MALNTRLSVRGEALSLEEEDRVLRLMEGLEKRLGAAPEPLAEVALVRQVGQRNTRVDLRLLLNPLGTHLVSHQAGETPEKAVRLAVEDIERQLERLHSSQAHDASYGVPSRREPEELRPNPPPA